MSLNWRNSEYKNGNKVNAKDVSKKLTETKELTQFNWLNEVSSVALQQKLIDQNTAFKRFFEKIADFPTFKKKNNQQSCRLTDNAFSQKNGQFFMAKSKEPLNIRWSRKLQGKPSSITISKDCADRYFISFVMEAERKLLPPVDAKIGIDLGLTSFITISTGEKIAPTKNTTKYATRLCQAQRNLSKKVKYSKNYYKANQKLSKIHKKIQNSRLDNIHKLSTRLINENQVICVEDLNIANMIKNKRYSKAIADASWSEFIRQLAYKANWYGRTIVMIDRWYPSSQTCSQCNTKNKILRINDRFWTCAQCGTHHDRDINAAVNIKTVGLTGFACGAFSIGVVKLTNPTLNVAKQEPPTLNNVGIPFL
jgi:putative transposase